LEVLRARDKDVFFFMHCGTVVSQKTLSSGVDFVVKSLRFETNIRPYRRYKIQDPEPVGAH
jgi:hypothetical protein